MSSAKGVKEVGYIDCLGGGQVYVDGTTAYVGHMGGLSGTSIIDVADPANPRLLAEIPIGPGMQSHKVRAQDGIMIVNREAPPPFKTGPGFQGGLGIFDVSNPSKPREITFWHCGGAGAHRFDFDGRYAYISPEIEGYHANIVMILDLIDPAKPREVGRWWMPGQWIAGGETPTWKGREHRCHHCIRQGDRLYVSYLHGGLVILDISDMTKPKYVSGLDWSPPFPHMMHSAVPVPFPVMGRKLLIVPDEDCLKHYASPPAFLWFVDVTDERYPMPISTFQLEGIDGTPQPEFTGCHQTAEQVVMGTEIPVAWFAHGMRIVDFGNPHSPKEVAHFVPPVPAGATRVQTNDVCIDKRGLIYMIDRTRGVHIVERT
jgi:hypothetical protein